MSEQGSVFGLLVIGLLLLAAIFVTLVDLASVVRQTAGLWKKRSANR